MSEAKHTPGPWEFRSESGYCSQIDGANGHTICCFDEDPSPQDAALMASAPELLAALEVVVNDWTAQFERQGHMAPAWCKQARDAIAKATS